MISLIWLLCVSQSVSMLTCTVSKRLVRFQPKHIEIKEEGKVQKHSAAAVEGGWLCVNDRTPVSLIIFQLTAAVNYSPGLCCRDELWGSGIKGTGGGRWNYKILMTELRLNGNFLNWFWRGAQKEVAWGGNEMGRGRGIPFPTNPRFFLSIAERVQVFLTSDLNSL